MAVISLQNEQCILNFDNFFKKNITDVKSKETYDRLLILRLML